MKRLLYILLISLSLPTFAQEQNPSWKLPSWWNEDQIVKVVKDSVEVSSDIDVNIRAISPALYVLRQQYQLKDVNKNTFHGKNSMNYFGETYSIAIRINKGYLLTQQVRSPWDYDADYKIVNNRGKRGQYQPVLFDSYLRDLDSDEYRKYLIEDRYVNMMVDSLLYDFDDGNRDFGLQIDNSCGKKEGTLIICHADESLYKNNAAKIELSVIPYSFDAVSKDNTIFDAPNMPQDNIIGGVFVLPKIEQIGQINYYLAGVLVFTPAGEWKVCSTATVFDNSLSTKESKKQ